MTLILCQHVETRLRAHAARAHPREACGLLAGSGQEILHYVEMPNQATGSDAFRIDPWGFLRADGSIRRSGLQTLGVFHSHPIGRAVMSPADRAGAWPEHIWLVLGTDALRAFAEAGGQWHPVAINRRSKPTRLRR